jgi:SAM-dependent methyltransferase
VAGVHHALTPGAMLALPDDLPFRQNSIDYIVALHMLEHVENPIRVIHHWLDIVKPGGGIGIVVPDWRYTWDSRGDDAPFSHKWNPTPSLIEKIYREHWDDRADLESLASYPYKLSFDFVLRKRGEFVPFRAPAVEVIRSGKRRHQDGIFLHGE